MTKSKRRGSRDTGAQAGDPVSSQEAVEPEPLRFTATVSDEQMYTWESQALQYPQTGPQGISYFRGELNAELHVDCLLYRDEAGELVGILNRYPTAFPPHEREGDQNIWVRPDRRRQGIGTALSREATIRWPSGLFRGELPPDRGEPKLTETGARWLEGMFEKRSVGHVIPTPPDVVYDAWLDAEGMREWMCPRPAVPTHIEIDPQVDGHYRIDIDNEGVALSVTGRYVAFERPRGLVFTWHCTAWDSSAPETVVIVQLEPRDEGLTLMTIRHLMLAEELQDEYMAGWGRIAAQLEERLAHR